MVNAFGYETEEEKYKRAILEGKVTPGVMPGMTAGMLSPEREAAARQQMNYDPTAKEAQYAAQMRSGRDALMNTGPAQGKTIGDIYVAPTWSEMAAGALKQGLGGYEMGQARKGQEAVQSRRDEASIARGDIEGLERAVAQQQTDQDNARKDATLGIAQSGLQRQIDADAADNAFRESTERTRQRELREKLERDKAQDLLDHEQEMELERLKAETKEKIESLKKKPESAYDAPKSTKEREKFEKGATLALESRKLRDDWKDEYASPALLRNPITKNLESYTEGAFGLGDKGQSNYWSRLGRTELEPRHEKFGSAFTLPEQGIYDATIPNQSLSPEENKRRLDQRVELEEKAARRAAASALMKNWSPTQVEMNFGDVVDVPKLIDDMESGVFEEEMRERQRLEREYKPAEAGVPDPSAPAPMTKAQRKRLAELRAKQAGG